MNATIFFITHCKHLSVHPPTPPRGVQDQTHAANRSCDMTGRPPTDGPSVPTCTEETPPVNGGDDEDLVQLSGAFLARLGESGRSLEGVIPQPSADRVRVVPHLHLGFRA